MKIHLKISRIIMLTLGLSLLMLKANAQVGIGTSSPESSAKLDVSSATKGFLLPKVTTVQKGNISPITGMQVFCTDCGPAGELQIYNGTAWTNISGATAAAAFTCGTSTVTFTYNGASVTYGTISRTISGTTKCWLDRNLGATTGSSTSNTDANALGDLFQWGRGADGHQLINRSTNSPVNGATSTLITDLNKISNLKINVNGTTNRDWFSPSNNTLWQSANGGINNPCPAGFRLPTAAEFTAETTTYGTANAAEAYASVLKLTYPGYRAEANNTLNVSVGRYWTSDIGNIAQFAQFLNLDNASIGESSRAETNAVRCIKN